MFLHQKKKNYLILLIVLSIRGTFVIVLAIVSIFFLRKMYPTKVDTLSDLYDSGSNSLSITNDNDYDS